MKQNVKDLMVRVLLKKAKGYVVKEKTDEYVITDGKKILVKSKVVTKRAPPDVTACKVLLQLDVGELNLTDMTDEQLQAEKRRLLETLANSQFDEPSTSNLGDGVTI